MFIHEIHHTRPTCTRVFRPVAIKNIVPTPMRHLDLHESRTPDRLLEIVEAMFRMLNFKGQVCGAVVVRGCIDV